jgi:diacylglycerol kinase family enzyme
MKPRGLVLLNPAARGGQGREGFDRVRSALENACVPEVVELDESAQWSSRVRDALAEGTRLFIAAGGDGTVHALVNALDVGRGDLPFESLRLGAIGLGSSNDFHKPVARDTEGVPVRLDVSGARPRDLMVCTWDRGRALVVVSASLGITAMANAFFNHGDAVLERLKRGHIGLAIPWAAIRTILRFQPLVASITIDGRGGEYRVNNLSVLKTPWLSGVLHFDTPVDPADGRLAVNLLEGRSRIGSLVALLSLARGRFSHLEGAHAYLASVAEVTLEAPGDLELDGEVTVARHARFELLPERILVCA